MIVHNAAGRALLDNLGRVILGKLDELTLLLIGVVADGHVLMEDVPGVGKTTLARALARSLDLDFRRVQFTPDLMPSDILGSAVLRPGEGRLVFEPGPVFTHVLLADEVNRASPRTQSALLEAMSERQVTSDGVSRPLPSPFFVVATQNPVEYQGTYPLPEAQLDRFLMRVELGYPAPEQEVSMLFAQQHHHPLDQIGPVADGDTLRALQSAARDVRVSREVAGYIVELARKTREHEELGLGVSPRGVLALNRACQARALLADRAYIEPDDVQALVGAVWAHRLTLSGAARYGGRSPRRVLDDIVAHARVPT